LCNKGMYLENGLLKFAGDINAAISKYTDNGSSELQVDVTKCNRVGPRDFNFSIQTLTITNTNSSNKEIFEEDTIELEIGFIANDDYEEVALSFSISDNTDGQLISCRSSATLPYLSIKKNTVYSIKTQVPLNLIAGMYHIHLGASYAKGILEYIPSVTTIEILPINTNWEEAKKPSVGKLITHLHWELGT
ncbi:MAG TPA: Wzt carbohydrate-binding domain-containing protein, partial [Chitinophagales bacterium]|nr:Wzt carbohydrate-binding domain-containing protein [Chitinophagales bacterium]